MKFIEIVENLSEKIEDSIEKALYEVQQAEGRLEALRQHKAEVMESLREVARGGEPDIDRIWLTDAEGNRKDLYIAFSEAIEAEGEAEVQKAVEGHLEGLEEAEIDELERSRADYIEEDSDWE